MRVRPRHPSRRTATRLAAFVIAGALATACGDDATDGASGDPPGDSGAAAPTDPPAADLPRDPYEVVTDLGAVRGAPSDVDGVRAFLTIPFAAPPTGDLRWRAPQPHPGWDDPLDATEPGFACPQPDDSLLAQILTIPDADEDCLTLNVWAPEDADGLPVMVWIHGGGLSTGSAHEPYYIGDQLAGRGVVLVSMNYRMGPLGFLLTDELVAEAGAGPAGNFGIADQRAALEWTQRNVAAFGGDPDDVTLFGESAGGFSVCAHLASEASAGLFHRAMILSGGGCNRLLAAEAARDAGAAFLDAVACDDLACARGLPVDDLVGAPFAPVIVADGGDLTDSARTLAARGELDVPLVIGSNADEATLFTIGREEPSDEALVSLVRSMTDDPEAVLELYPADAFETNLARYQAIWTDARFTCPALDFASLVPEVYVYHYTYVSPGNPFGLGATHGAELAFLFGHPEAIVGLAAERDEQTDAVADAIQRAWTGFARSGVPHDDWPRFDEAGRIMQIGATFDVVDEIRDGRCPALHALVEPR